MRNTGTHTVALLAGDPVRSEKNSVNGRTAGRQSVMVMRREGKIYIPEGERQES